MTVFTGYVYAKSEKKSPFSNENVYVGGGVNVYTSSSCVLEFSHQLFFLYSF